MSYDSVFLSEGVRLGAYMFIATWGAIGFSQAINDLPRRAVPIASAEVGAAASSPSPLQGGLYA